MYRLIRFYNQNKDKIIKIILIIVLTIFVIQLLNYFAKNKNIEEKGSNIFNNISNNKELLSNKSVISGENVPEKKLNNDKEIIEKFIRYCNEKNIKLAYEMITDECKEEMFPTIEEFNNIYFSKIFKGDKKSFTIENWVDNIYSVKITGDILSTGKLNSADENNDYMTIVKDNKEYKLNINNYIGRKIINKTTENKNVKITVQSIDTYMDYEIYNLIIENNSDNTILLDEGNNVNSIYLLDSKGMKYSFYSNEIIQNKLIIQSKFRNNLKIKFSNSYSSSRNIKDLVFSNMILNYEEYKNLETNKNFYEFNVKI